MQEEWLPLFADESFFVIQNLEVNEMKMNRVKQLRLEKGLRQLDLAKQIGVSEITISKIETGRVFPGTLILSRLASCLNTSAEVLTTDLMSEQST